jgi:P27 family predicted phage terminase small subunit
MPNIAKPAKVKELSGNPGKRALNKSEPKPTGLPSPPSVMTARAKTVWQRLVKSMPPGVYAATDSYQLAAYCEAVSVHQLATSKIAKGEVEVIGSTGQTKQSHWFGLQADAARLMSTLGAKLGLDPISRQQINSADTGSQVDDEFGDLIH